MRLEGTSTRVPVFGLRPTRGCRWRVRKLPKPRISILSPDRRDFTMLSKMASTITSESLRVISTTRETPSITSAFVMCAFSPFSVRFLPAFTLHSDVHYFFDGHGCSRGMALIIFEPGSFLVVGQSANTQPYFFLGFIETHHLEIHFLADGQRRFVVPMLRRAGDLGTVAYALHSWSQFHEHSEVRGAAHPAAHHVSNLMRPEEALPGIRLQLLYSERQAAIRRVNLQD